MHLCTRRASSCYMAFDSCPCPVGSYCQNLSIDREIDIWFKGPPDGKQTQNLRPGVSGFNVQDLSAFSMLPFPEQGSDELQSHPSIYSRRDVQSSRLVTLMPWRTPAYKFLTSLRASPNPLECMHAKSLQPCSAFCDPMDCSPPGSSIHGISQARILEWVAVSFSRGSSHPRDRTSISYISCISRCGFLPLAPPGKPHPVG